MDTQDVIDAFEMLDSWDDRYELIVDLGRDLLLLPDSEKTDENLVPGCTTRTWLTGRLIDGDAPVMEYRADAEGPLVRGLVALLLIPFQGKTPEEVLRTDPGLFVQLLGLENALSAKRRVGMYAFFETVKRIAGQY